MQQAAILTKYQAMKEFLQLTRHMCGAPCKFNCMVPWALNAWYHANTTSLKLRHLPERPMKVQMPRHRENREVGSSLFQTDKKTENLPKTIKKCFLQNLPATQGNVKVFKKGCTWVVAGWYYNIMASVAHSVLGDIRVLKYQVVKITPGDWLGTNVGTCIQVLVLVARFLRHHCL